VEIKPWWSSTKNATFIITPVFDQYYASCEEVFFFSKFFINTDEIVINVLINTHPGISNSKNGTNPCSPTSRRKIWKKYFYVISYILRLSYLRFDEIQQNEPYCGSMGCYWKCLVQNIVLDTSFVDYLTLYALFY